MYNLSSNFHGKSKGKRREKRRQLFRAKDFQSLMYPCFTFCHILGIFPYKINASTFEISKPRYILSAIVTCVCDIYVVILLYDSSTFENINMKYLPRTFTTDCCFGFGGFIMTVTFILCGPRMRLLQIISKISSRLPIKSYQKISKLIHAKDVIGFLILFGFVLMSGLLLQINLFFQMYITLVIFQMDMLYMNCVCVLKACFERINDDLAHMRKLLANYDSYNFTSGHLEQRHPFLIMELNALKKEHLMISDTIQMLNLIFSLQLIATIILTFFDITTNIYEYILNWHVVNLLTDNFIGVLCLLIIIILIMAFNFIKIVLIIWACETGKNQALQISTSVHDTFNNITDEQIKNELQLFSLQIPHCNNTFNTKGFTLDAKFLAKIVGSIATYVLILFQFKQMSSCEKETYNFTEIIF